VIDFKKRHGENLKLIRVKTLWNSFKFSADTRTSPCLLWSTTAVISTYNATTSTSNIVRSPLMLQAQQQCLRSCCCSTVWWNVRGL